jgi:hypothetical protein
MSQEYERLWEAKLFVTPGELARCLVVGGLEKSERAVSVYRKAGSTRADDYWVTVTIASDDLWEWINDDPNKRMPWQKLKVARHDMPLPASTARAVRRAWVKMLKGVRKNRGPSIYMDAPAVIFSATDQGRILRGQMWGTPKGNVSTLYEIADLLAVICTKGSKARERDLGKVELMARRVAGESITASPRPTASNQGDAADGCPLCDSRLPRLRTCSARATRAVGSRS